MNNLVVKRSQLVLAQIVGTPTVGLRYQFLDIPDLSKNNIVLYGLAAYSAAQLVADPGGNAVIAAAAVPNVVVTLLNNKKMEFQYQEPMFNLIRSNVGGFVELLQPRVINLTDCYIELTATTNVNAGDVVAFSFYYDYLKNLAPETVALIQSQL